MSLSAWQSALVELISAPRPGETLAANSSLSDAERSWLQAAQSSAGLRLTRSIQRSWRRMRLRSALRLTWPLLPQPQRDELVESYLEAHACTSFFDAPEACAFLEFVLPRLPPDPHLQSLCRFERALLIASAESAFLTAPGAESEPLPELHPLLQLELDPAAALVSFTAPPEDVIEAVLLGQLLPEPGVTPFHVLVTPLIPHCFRAAEDPETAVLQALAGQSRSLAALRMRTADADQAVTELLRVHSLRAAPAAASPPASGPGLGPAVYQGCRQGP